MAEKHYTPPLTRFLVCALFHEAQARKIPMTKLVNDLISAALKHSKGWQKAQEQMSQMQMGEGVTKYHTK